MKRVREGDPDACACVVRDYGDAILKVARRRLGDPAVRALLDAEDIQQSVLRSFFRRASSGRFTISRREQLLRLLAVMARNKAVDRVRSAGRLPVASAAESEHALRGAADKRGDPSALAAARDELAHLTRQLPVSSRHLLHRRLAGYSWDEIAERLGERADAVRKRLRRALSIIQ